MASKTLSACGGAQMHSKSVILSLSRPLKQHLGHHQHSHALPRHCPAPQVRWTDTQMPEAAAQVQVQSLPRCTVHSFRIQQNQFSSSHIRTPDSRIQRRSVRQNPLARLYELRNLCRREVPASNLVRTYLPPCLGGLEAGLSELSYRL